MWLTRLVKDLDLSSALASNAYARLLVLVSWGGDADDVLSVSLRLVPVGVLACSLLVVHLRYE